LVTGCLFELHRYIYSCISMLKLLVYLCFGSVAESVIPENEGVEKLQLLLVYNYYSTIL